MVPTITNQNIVSNVTNTNMINHRISKAENFTVGGAPREGSHHKFDRRVTRSALKAAGLQAISGLDSRGNPPSDALLALGGARPSEKQDVCPSQAKRLPALTPVKDATANSDTTSPLIDTPELNDFKVVLQQVGNMHRSEQGSAVTASVANHPQKLVLRVPPHPRNRTHHDIEGHHVDRSPRLTNGRATQSGTLEPQLLFKRRRAT